MKFTIIFMLFPLLFVSCKNQTAAQPEQKHLNVAYGPHKKHRMDVFIPNKFNAEKPAVVLVHGGAWKYGNKAHVRSIQKFLFKNNIPSFNINYRLLNDTIRHQQQLADIDLAIKAISANKARYRLQSDRFILLGESAGAHLSLLYGYANKEKVRKIISLSGPTDFYSDGFKKSPYFRQVRSTFEKVANGNYSKVDNENIFRAASPIAQASNVPTLIFQGGKDPLVSAAQGLALDSVLTAKNIPHRLVFMPNAGHVPRLFKKNRETIIYLEILKFISE